MKKILLILLVTFLIPDTSNSFFGEKEMSIIRQMKLLKDKGNTYRSIAKEVSKSTNKKFDSGWVFRILKRETFDIKLAV